MVDPMEELEYEEGAEMDDDAENIDLAEKKVDWNNKKKSKICVQKQTLMLF